MRLVAAPVGCSGCRACLLACSLHLFGENNPKRSALAIIPHFPKPGKFEVRVCTQCGICADVCPEGAIHRLDNGVYTIDAEACIACGICAEECPEGVIYSNPALDSLCKCDLCGECVDVCGMNVLSIGA